MGYKVNPPSPEELRKLAVQHLGAARVKNGVALSVEEARKLLEEVAVGKIEVEIQNRYLQETCTRLDAALNEISDLYEFAPTGCLSTDASGRITRLNLYAARLLGGERNALLGRDFLDFFAVPQRERLTGWMQQVRSSAQDQHGEWTLLDSYGNTQPVRLSLSARVGGQGHSMALSSMADFRREAHERMEEELQELRSVQQAVCESLPQYLAVLDGQGRVLRTNALWNAYGLACGHAYRNGLVHTPYAELMDAVSVAGADRQAVLAGIADVLGGKLPNFQLEYCFDAGGGFAAGRRRCFVMQAMAVRHVRARAVVSHQEVTHLMR